MTKRRFVHTLSFPEHIWLDFLRIFFSQETLIVDESGKKIANNFRFEESQIPENRIFDILLEQDMHSNNPDILPCIVIEDMGAASLGIALDRVVHWTVSPETTKTRSDLVRSTYVFHCCAKTRGESRLLASIVSSAVTVFYDQLLLVGLHKMEPWSIGKTMPVKADSEIAYADTPVQQTFEYQQTWKTLERSPYDVKTFCLEVTPEELLRYVRVSMDLSDPCLTRYLNTIMSLQEPHSDLYINTSMDVSDPLLTEKYILTTANMVNPLVNSRFVRTSMRVS